MQCFGTESFQNSGKQVVSSCPHFLALPGEGGREQTEYWPVLPGWACAGSLGATLCGDVG